MVPHIIYNDTWIESEERLEDEESYNINEEKQSQVHKCVKIML